MKEFFLDMVTDDDRRVSSARFLNLLVGIVTSVLMLWMARNGTLSVEWGVAYLAYGSGTFGMGKFLDGRANVKK